MKNLSDVNKFIDNFGYDLDENNCLRAQSIRKGLVIYIYIYNITSKNIMECVKKVASLAGTSDLNMRAVRRSIQRLVERIAKSMFHYIGRQLCCF